MSLTSARRFNAAKQPLDWLVRAQSEDGSIGVTATEKAPCWPTALAILAWTAFDRQTDSTAHAGCVERGLEWALAAKGKTAEPNRGMGHDPTLAGWPWVLGTHSWIEPTALFALALAAAGRSDHPRYQEAVALLADRLLPIGGCNYGNTMVLGQMLLPHVQPTGLAMLALATRNRSSEIDNDAQRPNDDPRIGASLNYLERTLGPKEATASLCFGLLGLSAHRRRPTSADDWIAAAAARSKLEETSAYKLALLALASFGSDALLLTPALDKSFA